MKPISTNDAAVVARRYRADPAAFCREVLGGDAPWSRQLEVLESVRDHRRTAVRSGHGVGKSWTVARAALWWLYTRPRSVVISTAPTERQVREVLWREIARACRNATMPLGGKMLTSKIHLDDDWFAMGVSTDEAERFQGFHSEHLLVVFDEAAGIPRRMWEAAEGMLSSAGSRMLAVGNPTAPSGAFHAACTSGSWRSLRIGCDEAAGEAARLGLRRLVSTEWIEERRRDWGADSPVYMSRVLGEFPPTAEAGLVPFEWIGAALARGADAKGEGRPMLGVDVARYGRDRTALVLRRGADVSEAKTFRELDLMEVTGRIVRAVRQWNVSWSDVFVDAAGLGAGVVDRLHEQGYPARGCNFAERASDAAEFENLRAEVYWRLREAMSPGAAEPLSIAPSLDELADELRWINYRVGSSGRLIIESKDRIRAAEGASPDLADALALTFAGYADEEAPGLWVI